MLYQNLEKSVVIEYLGDSNPFVDSYVVTGVEATNVRDNTHLTIRQ